MRVLNLKWSMQGWRLTHSTFNNRGVCLQKVDKISLVNITKYFVDDTVALAAIAYAYGLSDRHALLRLYRRETEKPKKETEKKVYQCIINNSLLAQKHWTPQRGFWWLNFS